MTDAQRMQIVTDLEMMAKYAAIPDVPDSVVAQMMWARGAHLMGVVASLAKRDKERSEACS